MTTELSRQRQVLYWRLLGAVFDQQELTPGFEAMTAALAHAHELPPSVLEGKTGIETLIRRHPQLQQPLDEVQAYLQTNAPTCDAVLAPSHHLLYSKLLLNIFGPQGSTITAQQYQQWRQEVALLGELFGFDPAALGANSGPASALTGPGGGSGGQRPLIDDQQLKEELVAMESDLIQRMDLREVLKDDALAAKIPISLPVIEQLFHDKSNLSGVALANAKRIIKSYVDQLAAVLRREVMRSSKGPIDRSVPPKRVYRNLDLKRTLWKNLPNYNPDDGRLYVDQLFYKHRSRKELMKFFIVVVDQSGSMVDAMTQCAILASIFATLPDVDVSLIAFDTSVVDLTPWAHDPFEALMRTNLGGGNNGPLAMEFARTKIQDPSRTTMVWISDFYERRELMPMIREVVTQGVHFIPVGSVSGSGYFSVDEWFRRELQRINRPVFTGNIKKLIVELKTQLS